MVAETVRVMRIEHAEGDQGQVFRRGDSVEQHGLVIGQAVEEIHHRRVATEGEESVIPEVP